MSDYDFRNKTFDHMPPSRSGSPGGLLLFVAALIGLFVIAMLFLGSGGGEGTAPVAPDAAPATETAPAPIAPANDGQ